MLEAMNDFLKTNALPALALIAAGILLIRLMTVVITKILDRSKLEKAAHSLKRF